MKTLVVAVLLIGLACCSTADASPGSRAGLATLHTWSAGWGSDYVCDTYVWEDGTASERCRTVRYCRFTLKRNKKGRPVDLKRGRCSRVAPWMRGTRTF